MTTIKRLTKHAFKLKSIRTCVLILKPCTEDCRTCGLALEKIKREEKSQMKEPFYRKAFNLNMKPTILGGITSLGKKHVFYGNFPAFLLPNQRRDTPIDQINGKLRSWERARIPLACSRAFARACKEALQQ